MTFRDDLSSLGLDEAMQRRLHEAETSAKAERSELTAGRIVRVDRGEVDVATGRHEADVVRCTTTKASKDCVAGDWVLFDRTDARVEAIADRVTEFVRRAARGAFAPQTLAANMDVVLIVQALEPGINERRLERELVLAHQSHATPIVVLTKTDSVSATERDDALQAARHVAGDTEVIAVSNVTGEGFEALRSLVEPGKTFALLGSSGVGKSTLVNSFAGEQVQLEGEIREGDGKGRHTTTAARLILLHDGHNLLDTPGVRALALWESWDGLAATFPEIEDRTSECGFADCFHDDEPNCAVTTAVATGAIAADRLESWRRLRDEMAELDAYLVEQQRKRERTADRRR